jgi:REP element-mobilizing transposase RayT
MKTKRIILHSNLPHISQKNLYQFITFRTKDSTDHFIKKLILNNQIETKTLQYKIDQHLDNSQNGAYLNGEIIDIAKEYILQVDGKLCKIVSFSIMPNHVHILLVQNTDLAKIVSHIKGGLSFCINKQLNKLGQLWQKGYFDKAIRDEKHFQVTYEYIKNNAIKAGLIDADKRFYSIYE